MSPRSQTFDMFTDAQSRSDRVYQAFGDSAPRWVSGETYDEYRRRLLNNLKSHSSAWKNADLTPFTGAALDAIEAQVLADAWADALNPANVPPGQLREIAEKDRTGRKISRFYGDPEACWSPFKQEVRYITGWHNAETK